MGSLDDMPTHYLCAQCGQPHGKAFGRKTPVKHGLCQKCIQARAAQKTAEMHEEIEKLKATYVPQRNAIDLMERLEAVGYGKPGKPNTLYGMVLAACDDIERINARVVALEPQGRMFRWILKKWGIAEDTSDGDVMGAMHVAHSHAHGYERYITAYKCNDKQGEIARQAAYIKQLELVAAAAKDAVERKRIWLASDCLITKDKLLKADEALADAVSLVETGPSPKRTALNLEAQADGSST